MKIPEPKKQPSGSWFCRLRLNGVSIPITAATAKECKRQAELIKAEYLSGKRQIQTKKNDLTVGEAVDKIIDDRRYRIDERSVAQYEDIRRLRFQELMNEKVSSLTHEKLDSYVKAELAKPSRKGGTLSVKTVKDAYSLITAAIKSVNKDIDTDFVFPERQRKFFDLLPPEEIWKAVYGTDIELPALLAMWLSLTASEIRGLTKSKSIRGDMMFIVETVVDIRGEATRRQRAKEFDRIRALNIPPYIKELIDKVDSDVIETRSAHALNSRFNKVLEQAGLPHMRFHDLRLVNTSMQITLDIPQTVTLQRNGWSTPDMMNRVYAQTFTGQRKAADAVIDRHMGDILNGLGSKNANENANEK